MSETSRPTPEQLADRNAEWSYQSPETEDIVVSKGRIRKLLGQLGINQVLSAPNEVPGEIEKHLRTDMITHVPTAEELREGRASEEAAVVAQSYAEQESDSKEASVQTLIDLLRDGHIIEAAQADPKLFVKPGVFDRYRSIKGETVLLKKGQVIDLPAGAFVSAEGLDSWEGRGIKGQAEKVARPAMPEDIKLSKTPEGLEELRRRLPKTSAETIRYYADAVKVGSSLPPIEQSTIYVLPDGSYFAKSFGSHRTAAAKSLDQETIGVTEEVIIKRIDQAPYALRQE